MLKTTDAELKGCFFLAEEVKKNILPLFELTRSRRSKNNPNASLEKKIVQLKPVIEDRPFILDLTTENDLSNNEIEQMLNSYQNGYHRWVNFIKKLKNDSFNVIPIIHYNPYVLEDVEKQIKELEKLSDWLAFRVELLDSDIKSYLKDIYKFVSNPEKLIVILDGKFISLGEGINNEHMFKDKINFIIKSFDRKPNIVCSFSSFPSYVASKYYGKDKEKDHFEISEFVTEKSILKSFPSNVYIGDYSSVHPVRYQTGGGGTWIPRVDFISSNNFYYYRFKRKDGGYERAAYFVINDPHYSIPEIRSWGDSQIEEAAKGEPGGLSPSFWISVRINLYITHHYLRLKAHHHMSL